LPLTRWLAIVALATSACVTDAELNAALDRDRDGFLPVQAGGDDCDETRASINPAADEICGDGVDNDCDGVPDDDGVGARIFFRDADGDGFGIEGDTVSACSLPEGYAEFVGDCDDTDPSFNPAVQDLCDGLDQDCDGLADDDDALVERFFDADLDGFGTAESAVLTCQNDEQLVALVGDCDDEDPSINPTATDACDGIDQDCDGVVDDDAISFTQYRDDDGDGWGVESDSDVFCELLPGFAALPGDCDDTNPGVSPEALDLCDGVDQNCDGFIDEDAVELVYYFDGDGDGAGSDDNAVASCEPLSGYVLQGGDCDDEDGSISPLATDVCDGVDQNCNGAVDDDALVTLYFEDADEDGRGNDAVSVEACTAPDGYVLLAGDCDDTDASIRPGAADLCDGVDQDCDGIDDEDATFATFYPDLDGDGVGDAAGEILICDAPPADYVADAGDCDDADAAVVVPVWYVDDDGDGFGTAIGQQQCLQPSGYAEVTGDCDDDDGSRNPGLAEICRTGVDEDCDELTDCLPGAVIDLATAPADVVSRYPLFTLPLGETTTGVFPVGNIVGAEGSADDFVITTTMGEFFVVSGDTLDFENPVGSYPTDCETFFSTDFTSSSLDELICNTGSGTIETWRGAFSGLVPHSTISGVDTGDAAVLVESSIHGPGVVLREPGSAGDIVFVPLQAGTGSASALATMRYEHDPSTGGIIAGVPCVDAAQQTTCAVIWGFTSITYVGPNHLGLANAQATVLTYSSPPPPGYTLPFTIFPNITSVGDFDANGFDELSFTDLVDESVLYFPGPVEPAMGPVDAAGAALGRADFDGDGIDDVILLAGVQGLLGFSSKAQSGLASDVYDTVIVGLRELDNQLVHPTKDVDRDGFEDIVTLSFTEVLILWGTGI
jgi:hypothetical protein